MVQGKQELQFYFLARAAKFELLLQFLIRLFSLYPEEKGFYLTFSFTPLENYGGVFHQYKNLCQFIKKRDTRTKLQVVLIEVVPPYLLIKQKRVLILDLFIKIVNSNKIMLGKSQEAFTKFIKLGLGSYFDYDSVWPWAEREFGLSQSREFQISMSSCTSAFETIRNKYISKMIENWPDDWHKNQRKFFLQILFCFCFSKNKHPLKMEDDDWQFISSIIFEKNPLFLKFQAYEHLKLQRRFQWGIQDDLIIEQCVSYTISLFRKCGEGNWNQISKLIFYQTNCSKFFSTKQIRERWNNHVRKSLKKGSWTNEEDIAVLEHVLNYNRRWSEITRVLQKTRTEHMIKNRYNFLASKHSKGELRKPEKILRMLDKIKEKEELQKTKFSSKRHKNKQKKQEQKQDVVKKGPQISKENSQQEVEQIKKIQAPDSPQREDEQAYHAIASQHLETKSNLPFSSPPPSFYFNMHGNLYPNFNMYQPHAHLPFMWLPMSNCQIPLQLNNFNETLSLPLASLQNTKTHQEIANNLEYRFR